MTIRPGVRINNPCCNKNGSTTVSRVTGSSPRAPPSLQAHRATTVVVDQQLQQTPIACIEAPMINTVQAEGLSNEGLINGSLLPPRTLATSDPAQQAVGNPGRTAARGRNAAAGLRCEGDPDQSGGALDDCFQVVLAVKLQPLDQRTGPQRGAQRSGAGGGPHKGEGRQVEGTGSCCLPLPTVRSRRRSSIAG